MVMPRPMNLTPLRIYLVDRRGVKAMAVSPRREAVHAVMDVINRCCLDPQGSLILMEGNLSYAVASCPRETNTNSQHGGPYGP